MQIRLAQDKDNAAIARLQRATIKNINSQDYPEELIKAWVGRTTAKRSRESAPRLKRWVAVENGVVIGFCDHDFKCELESLYVNKDHLGKGVGKTLLMTAEESMKKSGCPNIKVMSTITAKPFYQKYGYKIDKKGLHKIEGVPALIYYMSKKI